jgi:Cu+-exporting ATPase
MDTTAMHKTYTCPMHPAVLSDKPGKCPECGMGLVEKIVYVCPMHPEVVSDKPGKCPKCGMMLKIKADTPKHKHTDSTHKM